MLRFLPQTQIIFPVWLTAVIFAYVAAVCLLGQLPLSVGLFLRRNWARKLWLILLIVGLFKPLVSYWTWGPYSPKNSAESVAGSLTATVLLLAICLSRPFSRYMNRPGGKTWFWISLATYVVAIVGIIGSVAYWSHTVTDHQIMIIDVPATRLQVEMPEGWREAEIYGYVIPVPTLSTNNLHTFKDGTVWCDFMERKNEKIYRNTLMQQGEPIYRMFSSAFGISNLEEDYRFRFEHRFTLSSNLIRFADRNYSQVGFCSQEEFDMMFGLWTVDNKRSFVEVRLENSESGEYHELFFQSVPPLTVDKRLDLIARIHRAQPSP